MRATRPWLLLVRCGGSASYLGAPARPTLRDRSTDKPLPRLARTSSATDRRCCCRGETCGYVTGGPWPGYACYAFRPRKCAQDVEKPADPNDQDTPDEPSDASKRLEPLLRAT